MKVSAYTPKNKLIYNEDIESAYLPTLDGDLTILNKHNPIIGILRKGTITLRSSSNEEINIDLDIGYFEFSNNELTLLIEKTKLTDEELMILKQKAVEARRKTFGKLDKISEDEFEKRKESEGF